MFQKTRIKFLSVLLVLLFLCNQETGAAPIEMDIPKSNTRIKNVMANILEANKNEPDIKYPFKTRFSRSISHYKLTWQKDDDGYVKVPYEFEAGIPIEVVNIVEKAIPYFNNKTCVRFIPRTNEKDYIRFINGDGCWSYIGFLGAGAQELSLNYPGCIVLGTVVHEMLHALSFGHSMARRDRDKYIKIDYSNIPSYYYSQFEKHLPGEAVVHGQEFDENSVMMYPRYAFALDPSKPTITWLNDPNREFRAQMWSPRDIIGVNRLYKCYGYQMYE
ncbi:hatching enzyme 1.2 [Hydra vulgaris]|uniref:hatching enzyme 1.2 n=1 Tax=Hydra vulgaris TaxID=6087 RepID=UPI001F5F60CE|nr:hatching enzyme 1.2 [Hydra vulgaris]